MNTRGKTQLVQAKADSGQDPVVTARASPGPTEQSSDGLTTLPSDTGETPHSATEAQQKTAMDGPTEIARLNAKLEELNQLKTARVLRLQVEAVKKNLATLANPTANLTAFGILPLDGPQPCPDQRGSHTAPLDSDDETDAHLSLAKRPRTEIDVPTPTMYKGESRRSLVGWIRACEQVFDVRRHLYSSDHDKVTMARGYLDGLPHDSW